MRRHGIDLASSRIRHLCEANGIASLHVFGSILREDFGPHSDVDFLVRMRDDRRLSFHALLALEDELAQIVGRPVDIVLTSEIDSPDANPYRKADILATMEPVYAG